MNRNSFDGEICVLTCIITTFAMMSTILIIGWVVNTPLNDRPISILGFLTSFFVLIGYVIGLGIYAFIVGGLSGILCEYIYKDIRNEKTKILYSVITTIAINALLGCYFYFRGNTDEINSGDLPHVHP